MINKNQGGEIKRITSKDKIVYQEDIDKNNYNIKIKKTELNDLILALNIIITDLKNNQNRKCNNKIKKRRCSTSKRFQVSAHIFHS